MNVDEALFCVDVCRWSADAWASDDLEVAERFYAAAVVTREQCGDFVDVYDDQEVDR